MAQLNRAVPLELVRGHRHVEHHAAGKVACVRADGLAVVQQLLARLLKALQSRLGLRRLALTREQLAAALVECLRFLERVVGLVVRVVEVIPL